MESKIRDLCEIYKSKLLSNKIDENIINEIKNVHPDAERFFKEAEEWKNTALKLLDEGLKLIQDGKSMDCEEMIKLVERSKKMGGNVKGHLLGACNKQKAKMESKQDNNDLDLSGITEAINGNSIKQSTSQKEYTSFPWARTPIVHGNQPNATTPAHCMYQYCYYGLWNETKEREAEKNKWLSKYMELGGTREQLDKDKNWADCWLKRAHEILQKYCRRTEIDEEVEKILKDMGGPLRENLKNKIRKNQDRGVRSKTMEKHKNLEPSAPSVPRADLPITRINNKRVLTLSEQHHSNDICKLSPASHWKMYIDESGKEFEVSNVKSVIAGVIFDADHPLPKQPELHACEDKTEEKMKAADQLITTVTQSPCGVLVLPVSAYQAACGWATMIASFIDLVLRLLPIEKECTIEFFVERRGSYNKDEDFDRIRDMCLYNLMHSFPERAKLIKTLNIAVMTKDDPYNAYPDIISHSCGMHKGNPLAKNRFEKSGWSGSCFLNYPAGFLKNVFDLFSQGHILPENDWSELVDQIDSGRNNFVADILKTIGEEAVKDVQLWKRYLNYTISHLDSKAINMPKLGRQLRWLKRWCPENGEVKLPPRLHLLWLATQLAEANHRGQTEISYEKEFRQLVEDLYEEDAPLTCFATLHLAVTYTNAFRFAEAQKLVQDFCDIGSLTAKEPPFARLIKFVVNSLSGRTEGNNYVPAAIPGLRYYGQLLSSLGQHYAFQGDNAYAIEYFKEAITCFKKLSENNWLDISQTSAYWATAQMDHDVKSQETKIVLEEYLGASLEEFSAEIAANDSDADKYKHHILLRYLALLEGQHPLRNIYLENKENWKVGAGHPWEMIEFYRALLVESEDEKKEHLQKAYQIAYEGGPTLRIIACVILGSMYYWNRSDDVKHELGKVIDEVVGMLPHLGAERIKTLHAQLECPISPLDFAMNILPFNFR